MPFPELLELLALGALLGFLGGLLGIGGGLFAIPLLAVILNLDEQHAQGTSLVMVVPNVLLGLWNYAKRSQLDLRFSLTLAGAALPLTFVGAHFATHVPSSPLRLAFAAFTLCIAAVMFWRALGPKRQGPDRPALPWPFASLVGAFGGFLSGVFSVGGAIFAVPLDVDALRLFAVRLARLRFGTRGAGNVCGSRRLRCCRRRRLAGRPRTRRGRCS